MLVLLREPVGIVFNQTANAVTVTSGKCHELDCSSTCKVCYEVTATCVEINGMCQNGYHFYWSFSRVPRR